VGWIIDTLGWTVEVVRKPLPRVRRPVDQSPAARLARFQVLRAARGWSAPRTARDAIAA
jgi:hypothetical protein